MLLDCPPSLGVLTVAALTAADGVLIPLQCETLSHRGVGQLLDTVHDVRRFTNRKLEVWGVLPTLYDGRTNHARTVLETISETYDLEVVEPPIPKTIKFAEAPAAGRSILATSRSSKGARAYREVAANLVIRPRVRSARKKPPRRRPPRRRKQESRREPAPSAPVRPRYGRLAALGLALAVTAIAVLGGIGVLPSLSGGDGDARRARGWPRRRRRVGPGEPRRDRHRSRRQSTPTSARPRPAPLTEVAVDPAARHDPAGRLRHRQAGRLQRGPAAGLAGRRRAARSSAPTWSPGSVYDNLDPGTYAVYSRSEQA